MDHFWKVVVVVVCCLMNIPLSVNADPQDLPSLQAQLLLELLATYHKGAPPVHDGPVQVGLHLYLQELALDERNDRVEIHAWLETEWYDSRLKWDPNNYNGTFFMLISAYNLWIPNIEMLTSGTVSVAHDADVYVARTGYAFMTEIVQISFTCPMNFRFFPYDNQLCKLRFGSWYYNTYTLNLTEARRDVDLGKFIPPRDIKLTEVTAETSHQEYPCCPEGYAEMVYTFHLDRIPSAYSNKLILPAVMSGFLVLATFLLPPASHEKITLCGLLFLCLLHQLTYLHDIIPASGATMLGDYLAFVLFIDGFAIILAVISYHVYIRSGISTKSDSLVMEEEGVVGDFKKKDSTKVWLRYLDLASFILFSLVFIIGTAAILGHQE